MPNMPANCKTRLEAVTENGELLLETEDPSVQRKAEEASDEIKSFVYWTGQAEEIVNGHVTARLGGKPFRFTVLAEEATLGP